jgi:hypothetical protein
MQARHLFALALAACGAQSDNATPDSPPPIDAPPPFAEANHPAPPQMVKMTGETLSSPKIVPIFFANDSATQTQIEDFLHQLVGSSYWTATTSEYGVGALTIGATIVTSDTPPTSDTALVTWLQGHFNGQNGWPTTPDPQTIYSVFLPAGVVLQTSFGNSCQAFGAYHDEAMTTGTNQSIVYALMPRCDGGSAANTFDELTMSSSHEWIEAATDPRVESTPAFGDVDPDHYVWAYVPGAETGDMCEYVDAAYARIVGQYMVQRTWSNAAATAGHDPCVPAPDPAVTPFLGIAPVLPDMQSLPNVYGQGNVPTKGIQIAVGSQKTIEVDLYSDTDSAAWTVEAVDLAGFYGGQPELAFKWDKTSGKNGDKLMLTITRARAGTQMPGSEFMLQSKNGTTSVAQWWGYIAN